MKLSLWNRAVIAELVARSCQDAEFRKDFLAEPARHLAEAGFAFDDNQKAPAPLNPEPRPLVFENTPNLIHIVLPPIAEPGDGRLPFLETPAGVGPALSALVRHALVDAGLRARLSADPMACLAAAGIALPPGVELRVLEEKADTLQIVLPVFPESSALDFEELRKVAGGAYVVTFDSSTVGNTIGNYSFVQSASTAYSFLYAGAMQNLQVLLYTGQAVSSTASNASISCYQVAQSLYVQTSVEAEAEVAAVSMAVAALIADAAAEVNVVAVASVVMT